MALGPAGDQLPFRGSLVDGLLFTQPRGPRQETPTPKAAAAHLAHLLSPADT